MPHDCGSARAGRRGPAQVENYNRVMRESNGLASGTTNERHAAHAWALCKYVVENAVTAIPRMIAAAAVCATALLVTMKIVIRGHLCRGLAHINIHTITTQHRPECLDHLPRPANGQPPLRPPPTPLLPPRSCSALPQSNLPCFVSDPSRNINPSSVTCLNASANAA